MHNKLGLAGKDHIAFAQINRRADFDVIKKRAVGALPVDQAAPRRVALNGKVNPREERILRQWECGACAPAHRHGLALRHRDDFTGARTRFDLERNLQWL